jgi:hypothetical protein
MYLDGHWSALLSYWEAADGDGGYPPKGAQSNAPGRTGGLPRAPRCLLTAACPAACRMPCCLLPAACRMPCRLPHALLPAACPAACRLRHALSAPGGWANTLRI